MKKLIEKFNDYRYRKRLKKWAAVNIKFTLRKIKRFFKSARFKSFIKSVPVYHRLRRGGMHRGAVRYVRAVYKICLSVF